jgi:hypothetical protein
MSGEKEVCEHHYELVKDMSRVEGKIDILTLMVKESSNRQEGLFKKIDEHTTILLQQSNQLTQLTSEQKNMLGKVNEHDVDIKGQNNDVVVLKENNKSSATRVAIFFSAIVTALVNVVFFGVPKLLAFIFSLHSNNVIGK